MSTSVEPLSNDDHARLTRLVVELVWRIDHGRADTAHELFTEAGEMVLGPAEIRGRDQLMAWGAERSGLDRLTRHVCTNSRFLMTGPDSAVGDTLLTVYLHDGDGSAVAQPMVVGEYHDEFARVDGRWLFTSRRMERLFEAPG
jgi:hypothetical protein